MTISTTRKISLTIVLALGFFIFPSFSQTPVNHGRSIKKNIAASEVTFTPDDLEKVRTLIERHLDRKVSPQEFERFGKATRENLELFQMLDHTKKEDPFFSQEHITFIIESMQERLGVTKPKPSDNLRYAGKRMNRKM